MTAQQINAIEAAKSFWGRNWKAQLQSAWISGKYPSSLNHCSAHLQQLRNQGYRL